MPQRTPAQFSKLGGLTRFLAPSLSLPRDRAGRYAASAGDRACPALLAVNCVSQMTFLSAVLPAGNMIGREFPAVLAGGAALIAGCDLSSSGCRRRAQPHFFAGGRNDSDASACIRPARVHLTAMDIGGALTRGAIAGLVAGWAFLLANMWFAYSQGNQPAHRSR